MLSSPTPRPASTDLSFFSPPKPGSKVASTPSTSTVVVTTRVPRKAGPPSQRSVSSTSLPSIPPSSSSPATSNLSSPLSSPPKRPKKRKSLPNMASSSDPPRDVKRLRAASAKEKPRKLKKNASSKNSSRAGSRSCTLAPSPEPIYRSNRSRSTSMFPNLDSDFPTFKRAWRTEDDGHAGEKHVSSETVVKRLMKSYKAYFKNPSDPDDRSFDPHPTDYPVVELEYPNTNAVERFILLAPKDKDHYNPIMDLEKSLFTIVECYCTKEQQPLFGPIPSDTLSETVSPPPSPSPSPSNSSFEDTSSLSSVSTSSISSTLPEVRVPLLRALKRAMFLQDGPLFMKVMHEINALLRSFKYPALPDDLFQSTAPNSLMQAPESWSSTGMPKKVLMRIIEENYQRTVGPNVPKLRQYEAFSSTVYGELMPSLVDELMRITNLREDSLFVDMGSGVGNVVVQASLQTGCKSFGIELMPAPASVAEDVLEQMRIRCRMWGVKMGDVELEKGDMLKSAKVDELLPKADVVLVDNKVFEESLNEALRPKFLDLKEGAIVISLSPFVNSLNARVTERNVDDISAIFDVTEREYHSGSVSWGNNGGTYYLHRVDRKGYAEIREKFENSRAVMGRSSRRR